MLTPLSMLNRARSLFQLAISVLILITLTVQFIYGLSFVVSLSTYILELLTYFTILSNIFVAVVFCVEGVNGLRGKHTSPRFETLRGAAVFCILTTGIVHTFFLRGPALGMHQTVIENSFPWINDVFHMIVPSLVTLDWIIFPPKHRINWSTIFSWIGITLVYLFFVEIAGLFLKAYPYFFLDPTLFRGYRGVLFGSVAFLPFFFAFGIFLIGIANTQYFFRARREKKVDKGKAADS